MRWKEEFAEARRSFDLLSFYEKFEQIVIFILTVLIAVFVVFAVWNLALKVFQSIASSTFRPDRLYGVPVGVRCDFDRHHCARVQAIFARLHRASAKCCAGPHRDPDCAARYRPQSSYPRCVTSNDAVVRACGSHHRARSGLLACQRSGPEHRRRRLCAATQSHCARWARKESFFLGEIAMQERKVSQAPDLFSPAEVGPLELKNRVVMAPLTRSRAGPGNVPTQLNALYYAQRASAGLIIAEATQIAPEGQGYISTPGNSQRRTGRRLEMRHQGRAYRRRPHRAATLACRTHLASFLPAGRRLACRPVGHQDPMARLSRQKASSRSRRRARSKPPKFPASSSNMRKPREML